MALNFLNEFNTTDSEEEKLKKSVGEERSNSKKSGLQSQITELNDDINNQNGDYVRFNLTEQGISVVDGTSFDKEVLKRTLSQILCSDVGKQIFASKDNRHSMILKLTKMFGWPTNFIDDCLNCDEIIEQVQEKIDETLDFGSADPYNAYTAKYVSMITNEDEQCSNQTETPDIDPLEFEL